MAHTKAQKAAAGNRDSIGKRLGVKIFGNQRAEVGNIIVRQRGMTMKSGDGTRLGKDFTIYAMRNGVVSFKTKHGKKIVCITAA